MVRNYLFIKNIYYVKIVVIAQNAINHIVLNVEYYALNVIKNIAKIVWPIALHVINKYAYFV